MKKFLFILTGMLIAFAAYSQVPEAFKYQAVVRDNTGNPIAEQTVNFQIDILKGSTDGSTVYSETHSATTNTGGLVNLEIGNGTSSDDFSAITWGMDSYFVKLWVNGDEMGTSQLLSVPYALHAKSADHAEVDTANTFRVLSEKGSTPCNASTRGAMRYNETSNTVEFCNGSNWISMASGLSIGLPQISTNSVNEITANSATSGGSIISNEGAEIFEKGICWNTTGAPLKSEFNTEEGSGNQGFLSYLTGLTSFETYYVRSYATNTAGTGYGEELNFKTEPQAAIVSTKVASFIDYSSFGTGGVANVGGKETIEERGVVYGKNASPTKSDNFIVSGSGTGDFSVTLINLEETLYYFRAYAINEAGINYGTELSRTKHVDFEGNKIAVMPTTSGAVSFVNFSEDSQYAPIAISGSDGQNNTTQLISRFGSDAQAAYMCDTLSAYGYTDWYLPARDELNKLYENKESLGSSVMEAQYWSSTERNSDWYAAGWAQDFSSGHQFDQERTYVYNVVCVRKDND